MNNTNSNPNSAKGYKLFNRHEVFTRSTHDTVWSIRGEVEITEYKNTGEFHGDVLNKIMGLFDGYLYDGLLEEVAGIGCSSEVCSELNQVIKFIESHIELNGETETPIF